MTALQSDVEDIERDLEEDSWFGSFETGLMSARQMVEETYTAASNLAEDAMVAAGVADTTSRAGRIRGEYCGESTHDDEEDEDDAPLLSSCDVGGLTLNRDGTNSAQGVQLPLIVCLRLYEYVGPAAVGPAGTRIGNRNGSGLAYNSNNNYADAQQQELEGYGAGEGGGTPARPRLVLVLEVGLKAWTFMGGDLGVFSHDCGCLGNVLAGYRETDCVVTPPDVAMKVLTLSLSLSLPLRLSLSPCLPSTNTKAPRPPQEPGGRGVQGTAPPSRTSARSPFCRRTWTPSPRACPPRSLRARLTCSTTTACTL